MSTVINQRNRMQWRELGFFYENEFNDANGEWRFWGSKKGLMNFVKLLDNYINTPALNSLSEDDRYGPYQYLKIMTWYKPEITLRHIAGTFNDLSSLKKEITNKLSNTQINNSFVIDDYDIHRKGILRFFVMEKGFDPASMDTILND